MFFLRLCFSFSGRINRAKYWLGLAIAFCIGILGIRSVRLVSDATWGLLIVATLLITYHAVALATATKRLHDLDFSGWWAPAIFVANYITSFLIIFMQGQKPTVGATAIPTLIFFALLIWLGSVKGMATANRFGPSPLTKIDYYPVIARAVANLTDSTPDAREVVYERARKKLANQLSARNPPASRRETRREQRSLAAAIRRLEGFVNESETAISRLSRSLSIDASDNRSSKSTSAAPRALRSLPFALKAFAIFMLVLSFGPPFYFGHIRAPFWTAILWSAVISFELVAGGWRAPMGGFLGSLLAGTAFAAVWCVPTFFIGKLLPVPFVGVIKWFVAVLLAYLATGVFCVARDFYERNPVRRKFYMINYKAGGDWKNLFVGGALWLPGIIINGYWKPVSKMGREVVAVFFFLFAIAFVMII